MRNIEVVIALLFGYFIAFLTRHNGMKYVTTSQIDSASVFTFIWKKWFGIGFYTPALLREPSWDLSPLLSVSLQSRDTPMSKTENIFSCTSDLPLPSFSII